MPLGKQQSPSSYRSLQSIPELRFSVWILLLAQATVTKYFSKVKNRFLLAKCITMGALSFPTPFFIYFFITNVDPNDYTYSVRFLLISILLLSGALIGVGSYYKDSAIAALKDWYPSEKS